MRIFLYWSALLVLLSRQVASQPGGNITVDDSYLNSFNTRSGIQYFPSESSWQTTALPDLSQRFNGTLHLSSANYTRVAFFFQGSEIYYYGDKGPGYGSVWVNIDGEPDRYDLVNASSSVVQYQQLLWSRTGLGPGDHQIIITKNNSIAGPISMDFFEITPSNTTIVPSWSGPGAYNVPDEALSVDNTDIRIKYSGDWELIQNSAGAISPPNSIFYRNTVHRTTVPGAVATFTFAGTAVWYFSDIDVTHGYVDISLDGGPPDSVSGYHDPILSQRHIWSKTGLPPGNHNVTITHRGTPVQYATLDFFRYLPSDANGKSPTESSPGEGGQHRVRIAPIVGGAIAGLAGLGVVILGLFLLHRRHNRNAGRAPNGFLRAGRPTPEPPHRIEPYEATPFIASQYEYGAAPIQTRSAHSKPSNYFALNEANRTDSSTSEFNSYTSSGSSRVYTTHDHDELPPSYR